MAKALVRAVLMNEEDVLPDVLPPGLWVVFYGPAGGAVSAA